MMVTETIPTVTLPLLDAVPGLRYVVSRRDVTRPLGGDMSFTTGHDDPSSIVSNRATSLETIGATLENTVMCGLVHGISVAAVTQADAGRGMRSAGTTIPETDALFTDVPGLTLGMCFADCTPLIVVDPVRRAIALGHAGWRGTLAGMAGAMVRAICDAYGSNPAELIAVIGPAIGPEVYEVGADVAMPFTDALPTAEVLQAIPDKSGKWLLDLWGANAIQFHQAGLCTANVAVSGICTLTHGNRFFSHRYARLTGEREGRFAVFLHLT